MSIIFPELALQKTRSVASVKMYQKDYRHKLELLKKK